MRSRPAATALTTCSRACSWRPARAISTAIGYNQLLTTNSVELIAEQGRCSSSC